MHEFDKKKLMSCQKTQRVKKATVRQGILALKAQLHKSFEFEFHAFNAIKMCDTPGFNIGSPSTVNILSKTPVP